MRHAVSALAVLTALPGAMTARAQEIQFPTTVAFPDVTLDPDTPTPIITADDIYLDAPTVIIEGRARVGQYELCEAFVVGEASQTAFEQLNGRQRSNAIAALCTLGAPGSAFQREAASPDSPPFIVLDVDEIASDQFDWALLSDQQRGWWMDYVRDHEIAHTHFRPQPFRAAVAAAAQRRWTYEELAPDLTAICLAWADVLNPDRGGWVEGRVMQDRAGYATSTTHGVFADLFMVSLSDFGQQCVQLGHTLPADQIRPAASRLALTRTLALANPPRPQVAAVAPR